MQHRRDGSANTGDREQVQRQRRPHQRGSLWLAARKQLDTFALLIERDLSAGFADVFGIAIALA